MRNIFHTYPEDKQPRPYTLTIKVTYETHSEIAELANKTGTSMNKMCLNLVEKGLEEELSQKTDLIDNARLRLFKDVRDANDRQHILAALAKIKHNLTAEEFSAHCRAFGADPTEVDELLPPHINKRTLCQMFLRTLFTDRPEGMPANRVLEISAKEGFGENMIRQEARKLGIFSETRHTSDGKMSIWIPPSEW